ncbi:BRO family protein [Candidatus Liberibacter asiaticus]|uniref:BRO family protein n=1 Tax=Liberibacter asiaticus TaxID=34021 RepID=UPI001F32F4DC|nr:BRO family protein [Candidatus Liberibacter asiaticus]
MSTITPFEFESNQIPGISLISFFLWFVAKDVAVALGYENSNEAINAHCYGVAKRYPISDSLGRTQKVRIIAEPDVSKFGYSYLDKYKRKEERYE